MLREGGHTTRLQAWQAGVEARAGVSNSEKVAVTEGCVGWNPQSALYKFCRNTSPVVAVDRAARPRQVARTDREDSIVGRRDVCGWQRYAHHAVL